MKMIIDFALRDEQSMIIELKIRNAEKPDDPYDYVSMQSARATFWNTIRRLGIQDRMVAFQLDSKTLCITKKGVNNNVD